MKYLKDLFNRIDWDSLFWMAVGAIMVCTNLYFILDFVFTEPFPNRYFAPLLVVGVVPGLFLGLALLTRMVTSITFEDNEERW